MTQTSTRILTAYELNHLARFGQSPSDLLASGDMPVEYATGHVQFRKHDFLVTPDVLIPRIETEEIVTLALTTTQKLWSKNPSKTFRYLDVGTGSGAIGISLGVELEQLSIPFHADLVDISPAALQVAQKNVQRLAQNSASAFSLYQSDVLSIIPLASTFDLILANHPYIPHFKMSTLPSSVAEYEPELALDGGEDGLKLIRLLLESAPPFVNSDFEILLEIDETHRQEQLQSIVPQWQVSIVRDSFDKPRFAQIRPDHLSI